MSTDCENLLKKLLVLNPVKRGSLEVFPPLALLHLHSYLLSIQKSFCTAGRVQSSRKSLRFGAWLLCVMWRHIIAAVVNCERTVQFTVSSGGDSETLFITDQRVVLRNYLMKAFRNKKNGMCRSAVRNKTWLIYQNHYAPDSHCIHAIRHGCSLFSCA